MTRFKIFTHIIEFISYLLYTINNLSGNILYINHFQVIFYDFSYFLQLLTQRTERVSVISVGLAYCSLKSAAHFIGLVQTAR